MDTNEHPRPDPALRGRGLSATGHTADELHVGQTRDGTTYDDPGGVGTAYQESVDGDPDAELGQPPDGDATDGADPGQPSGTRLSQA